MAYESLLKKGLIKSFNAAPSQISDRIGLARRDVDTARTLSNSDWVYNIAYNAMLQAARALMFAEGYRTAGGGCHRPGQGGHPPLPLRCFQRHAVVRRDGGGLHLPGATTRRPRPRVCPPRGSLVHGRAAGARCDESGIPQALQAHVDPLRRLRCRARRKRPGRGQMRPHRRGSAVPCQSRPGGAMANQRRRERVGHVYLLHTGTQRLCRLPGPEEIEERRQSKPARIDAPPPTPNVGPPHTLSSSPQTNMK